MNTQQEDVRRFMKKGEFIMRTKPGIPVDEHTLRLAIDLVTEEVKELQHAHAERRLTDMAQECADIVYVVNFYANTIGVNLQAVFDEVHAANMEKFRDGVIRDHGGKIQKPAGWTPPNVKAVLERLASGRLRTTEEARRDIAPEPFTTGDDTD